MSITQTVFSTLQAEIESYWEVEQTTRMVWRLFMALVLGAIIGWDRERRDAEAGLRTHMLVALGAALFVLVPQEAGMNDEQLSRVLQGLVSGIGFLGAGAVLKDSDEGRIHGLTTAATIWATAAVGIAAGLGHTGTAAVATTFMLVVLVWLRRMGHKRGQRRQHKRDTNDDNHGH